MTSPNTKAAEKTPQKKANTPAHVATGSTAVEPPSNTPQFRSCGMFSWLKVFRYADLLMRQGC